MLVVNEKTAVGKSKSFKERAIGPFRVTERFNDVNYVIVPLGGGKSTPVHYNRLRRYNARSEEEMLAKQEAAVVVQDQKVVEEKKTTMEVVVEGGAALFWRLFSARPVVPVVVVEEVGAVVGEENVVDQQVVADTVTDAINDVLGGFDEEELWGRREQEIMQTIDGVVAQEDQQDLTGGEDRENDLLNQDDEEQAVAVVMVNTELEQQVQLEVGVVCKALNDDGTVCGKVCKSERGRSIHHGTQHKEQLNVADAVIVGQSGGVFNTIVSLFSSG